MALPKRKTIRLPEYDCSSPGAYFVTICTRDRRNLFWNTDVMPDPAVGAAICRPQGDSSRLLPLTKAGKTVDLAIRNIHAIYPHVSVDKYVIMPNHVHMIVSIHADEHGRQIAAPTVSTIIGHMKRWASKQAGEPLWQKSYHEHVIRGEADYREIWDYVENNSARWAEDRYYQT